jgi:hypothetical protein
MSNDRMPPLERALASAARLKEGTGESVEALALLAIQARDRPDAMAILDRALDAVASQERCKWRRGAAPWWSMLGRLGGGPSDVAGVSADRGGRVEDLQA